MDKRKGIGRKRRRKWRFGQLTGDQVAFVTALAITGGLWIAAVWKIARCILEVAMQ